MSIPATIKVLALVFCGLMGCLVGGCAVGMAHEQRTGPVRTSRLEVVDDKGIPRITLGTVDIGASAGAFGMELNDPDGRNLSVFGAKADGTQILHLKDPEGGADRVQMAVSNGGTVDFVVTDRARNARVRLRVMPNGAARVELLAKDGTVVEQMRTTAE